MLSFKFFSREEIKQIASSILSLLVKNTIYTNIQDGQSDLPHIQIAKFICLEDIELFCSLPLWMASCHVSLEVAFVSGQEIV